MRCAIYTRKSSEEGLEQDFNSLQAQREACEAYIASQKHEGWIVLPTCYDDGGVSGATVPDYSTLSRRQSSLATFLTVSPSSRPRHVVVDATGLRVYGSGEGHVRKHRHGRRRAWRKLHLGVDERTKEIVAVEVTPSRVHDGRLLPALLDQIPGRIVQVSGDGAYDSLKTGDGRRASRQTTTTA